MTTRRAIELAFRAMDKEDRRAQKNVDEFGDGNEYAICTRSAEWLRAKLGGDVFGYFHEDNPSAKVGEVEGGHDFLLLDDYIVDWWLSRVRQEGTGVYHRVKDAGLIRQLYGDESKWEPGGSEQNSLGTVTIPCGDCFRWAAQTAQTLPGSYVVHAMVRPAHAQKYMPHAWVEYMTPDEHGYPQVTVLDYQRNAMGQGPQLYSDFSFLMHPRSVKRYTPTEALANSVRFKHWGPW